MTHAPQKKPRTTLPAFTPVPRKCQRHDGWTPQRQHDFVEALADLGSVRAAANSVGMTPESAYQLRRQEGADTFRKAWQAALDLGTQRIEDVAMDRALNGVEVPVYAYGKIIGTRRVYNDKLLMFMLRNRASRRFAADGAGGLSALDKSRLARMKKEWRKEWEAERAAESNRSEKETFQSLDKFLSHMRERRNRYLSPATKALREELRKAEEADRAAGIVYPKAEDADADADSADAAGAENSLPPRLPTGGIPNIDQADYEGDE